MRNKHLLLLLMSICIYLPAFTQLTDPQKLEELNTLINRTATKGSRNNFITPYVLDSIMLSYQNTLSGSQVETGKLIGSSISVTDQGAVANIGLKRIGSIYTQVTLGGRGKDNFISLFDKGQYGNTLSGGLRFQWFRPGSGFYNTGDANRLHHRLVLLQNNNANYQSGGNATTAYDSKLTYIFAQLQNLENGDADYNLAGSVMAVLTNVQRQNVENYLQAADTLIKLGLISEKFLDKTDAQRAAEILALRGRWSSPVVGAGPDERRLRYYLQDAEVLQLKANWNLLRFHWLSFGIDYNATPYKILDTQAKDEDYTRTDNDNYFAVSISNNLLWTQPRGDQRRFFWSLTGKFSYARVYSDADKMTLERLLPYTIDADLLAQKTLNTEVYPGVASRKFVFSLESPFIVYWNKANIGVEISPKVGVNDPKNDNVGLRLGVYIPAQVSSGVPLIVQPIFRLRKLFESSTASFWKDNVVVGFNVSVSMPKGLGKVGK